MTKASEKEANQLRLLELKRLNTLRKDSEFNFEKEFGEYKKELICILTTETRKLIQNKEKNVPNVLLIKSNIEMIKMLGGDITKKEVKSDDKSLI